MDIRKKTFFWNLIEKKIDSLTTLLIQLIIKFLIYCAINEKEGCFIYSFIFSFIVSLIFFINC